MLVACYGLLLAMAAEFGVYALAALTIGAFVFMVLRCALGRMK